MIASGNIPTTNPNVYHGQITVAYGKNRQNNNNSAYVVTQAATVEILNSRLDSRWIV